jgi:hypothetical protein
MVTHLLGRNTSMPHAHLMTSLYAKNPSFVHQLTTQRTKHVTADMVVRILARVGACITTLRTTDIPIALHFLSNQRRCRDMEEYARAFYAWANPLTVISDTSNPLTEDLRNCLADLFLLTWKHMDALYDMAWSLRMPDHVVSSACPLKSLYKMQLLCWLAPRTVREDNTHASVLTYLISLTDVDVHVQTATLQRWTDGDEEADAREGEGEDTTFNYDGRVYLSPTEGESESKGDEGDH